MRNLFFVLMLTFLAIHCKEKEPVDNSVQLKAETYSKDPLLAELTKNIEADPDNPEFWAARAKAFYERDAYDEAIGDLSAAMKIDSVNVDYHHLLADVYIDYYKSRMALNTLTRAATLHPEHIPTLLKLAELQLILEMQNESMQSVEKVLKLDPENADAYVMLGLNFKEIGDTAMAVGSFKKAVNYDPDKISAWINMGQLQAARNVAQAEQYFNTAIRLDSLNTNTWLCKADYHWEKGERNKALETYKKIIEIDHMLPDAYYNSGLVYLEMDSIEQAQKHFDLTIETNPLFYKAYYYKGLTLEKQGKTEAAKDFYQQSLNMAPNFDKPRKALDALNKK
jgi:tetratricopeptide (TPR) repeat protein